MNESKDIMKSLIGLKLTSVEFVADYVQLLFKDHCFSIINDPYLLVGDKTIDFGTIDFCNKILALIGLPVCESECRENEYLRICFSNQECLYISIKDGDYLYGPEAAILDCPNHEFEVW